MSEPIPDERDAEIARLRAENDTLRARYEDMKVVYHDNGQQYRDEIGLLRENARYMIEKLTQVLGETGHRPGEQRPSVNRTGAVEHAVLNCPHEETEDTLILRYDPRQRGATVGSQLTGRIADALGMGSGGRDDEERKRAASDVWLACNPSGIERDDIIRLLREVWIGSPLDHPDWRSLQDRAKKLADALAVMPRVQTDEETSRAACRLLQQISAISTRDLTQHDRDVRTLIEATWQRGTPPRADGVPLWIIERVRNCELEAGLDEYIGLADHAAFSAGQDNAVDNVLRMLKTATREKTDD